MDFLTDGSSGLSSLIMLYLLIVNFLLLFLMGFDKARAKRRGRRISELTLFLFAICGGSFGGCLGMLAFRHKTKHLSFFLGFPAILVLQITFLFLLFFYYGSSNCGGAGSG